MKLLIKVSIPAIGEHYDILVPSNMRIKSIVSLITGTVEKLSDYRYAASGRENLCAAERNILLRHSATLGQYGIRNGDHLILM